GSSSEQQHRSFGTSVLDRGTHQRVEQLFKDHFAGNGLRDLDHGRQVELFERGVDRPSRNCGGVSYSQVRIELIELPDLPIGAPTEIAVTGISQVRMRDGVEPTCRVEPSRQLVGARLVVDELVLARGSDRVFIQALRIKLSSLDASDLCSDEPRAVLEILRAIPRPDIELSLMKGQSFQMLYALVGRCGVAVCRASKRAAKVVFGSLEDQSRCR